MQQLLDILPIVEKIAIQAGEVILAIYHQDDLGVQYKNDQSPLTLADLAAHRTITEGLQNIAPNIPILSEESAKIPFEQRKHWQQYWLIDPLDGTKEFIKKNGEFTVNIALINNHQVEMGVVYVPTKQALYSAIKQQGAHFQDLKNKKQHKMKCRIMDKKKPIVVGSRSHPSHKVVAYLDKLGAYTLLSIGSSLKFCKVAEGSADLYIRFGLTSEWDTAAAHCIVEEAGGTVLTLTGRELLYNTKASLLNPEFIVFGDDNIDWLSYL